MLIPITIPYKFVSDIFQLASFYFGGEQYKNSIKNLLIHSCLCHAKSGSCESDGR